MTVHILHQLAVYFFFLKYIHYASIHMHSLCKSLSTTLGKGLRENIKKKKKGDREIGKHKLSEMGALNMKRSETRS